MKGILFSPSSAVADYTKHNMAFIIKIKLINIFILIQIFHCDIGMIYFELIHFDQTGHIQRNV